jgi:hypothetical protein
VNALATLIRDAADAACCALCQFLHKLTRDKGYAVAASSGAEHELDYYTGVTAAELAEILGLPFQWRPVIRFDHLGQYTHLGWEDP